LQSAGTNSSLGRTYAIEALAGLALPENMAEALDTFPNLRAGLVEAIDLGSADEKMRAKIHYLIIHCLQVERLKRFRTVSIPEVRFVFGIVNNRRLVLSKLRFVSSRELVPFIVQEKIEGLPLWEMFDPRTGQMYDQ